jgi:two-component system response regulator YesN
MNYKAVIIDDESWNRDVIRTLGNWETLSIEIAAEASDGDMALELISHLRPDIIITDVKMPRLNGIDLLTALRDRGNRCKTIFVSAYDDFTYVRDAMRLGAVDYLLKPIKSEELNRQLINCVKTLKDEGKTPGPRSIVLNGFMEADWMDDYTTRRASLYDSLFSNNIHLIKKNFDDLSDVIIRHQDSNAPEKLVVYVYFDLHHSLEHFIISRGFKVKTIIQNDAPLVFSRELCLEQMLAYIYPLFVQAAQKTSALIKAGSRIDISRIREYISRNYHRSITLENTAARFLVSKEYLSRAFKAENGRCFSDHVTELRMRKAYELLVAYRLPIKEIVERVGYIDTAHFYKVFKKYFGISPGKMRNEASQIQNKNTGHVNIRQ